MPAEEWHHAEHFPIKDAQSYLLVYELMPHDQQLTVNTIDQFGLNTLEVSRSKWLCVPAQLVSRPSATTD